MENNLHSFFQQNYPEYEIIMGFNNSNDPAIEVADKLIELYPNRKSKIIVNQDKIGLNPKINNLVNMYPYTCYNHILISDSNIQVSKDYLVNLVKCLEKENVGLVTSAIRGMGAKRLGAILENLHLNSFIISSVFVAHKIFMIPISIGKSMLLKKETLLKIGGFKNFKNFLAEDHLMSQAIKKLGLKVEVSNHFVDNINENWSVEKFLNRHTRWAKMRKTSNLFYYLSEVFSNPIFLGIFYTAFYFQTNSIFILSTITILKILFDGIVLKLVQSDLKWYHLALIPIKDVLIGITWWTPIFSRTVNWRGNTFKISKNTQLLQITKGG